MRTGITVATALAAGLYLVSGSIPIAAQTADTPEVEPAAPNVAAKPAPKAKPQPEARKLFGAKPAPAPLEARASALYSRGCLAGARPLAIDGPAWQAMRLSRNRNWGHPDLVALVERLAVDVKAKDGWRGLLVGDISQPRGGPMLTGHASHQIGLDADIWLTEMPDRRLTEREREDMSAISMLGTDGVLVDPKIFTPAHARIIRRAASYPEVERVLVHPGIKKALCEDPASDKATLAKIRPFWGHHYHMHIRIACPPGNDLCKAQPPTTADDGCGEEVDTWIAQLRRPKPPPDPEKKPPPPRPQLTMDQLPAECRLVLETPTSPAAAPPAAARPPAQKGASRDK